MNNNAMKQIETASIDELRSLQLERMKNAAACLSEQYGLQEKV